MALVKMPDNGQQFSIEDEIAQSDDLLKAALRAVYPEIGDARISRENKDGQMVVSIVKQAGRKGQNALVSAEPLVVDIDQIRTDGGTQTRAKLDMDVAEEYAEAMRGGAVFPPIEAMYDGQSYWVTDGFHRVAAARRAGQEEIATLIFQGTRRDAILRAVGANQVHGLRRTNEDKRRAVTALLSDAEWARWSDRAIGEACGVAHTFVANMRRELSGNGLQMPQERTVQRGEQTYMFTPATPQPKTEPGEKAEVDEEYIGNLEDGEGTEIDEEPPVELESDGDLVRIEPGQSVSVQTEEGKKATVSAPPAPVPSVAPAPAPRPAPTATPSPPPAPAAAPTPAPGPVVNALPWEKTEYTVSLNFRPQDVLGEGRVVIMTVSSEGVAPSVGMKREMFLALPAVIRDLVAEVEGRVTARYEGQSK